MIEDSEKREGRIWEGTGFRSFEEAREYVQSLGFLNFAEWEEWVNWRPEEKPPGLPSFPEMYYEDEWQGWDDWLWPWRSFEEARDFVRSLGLRSAKE